MKTIQLGTTEERFAQMIWEKAPVKSGDLVKICESEFGWKRTTTHTVLKRLCDKGLFENNHGLVTPRISREEFEAARSEEFVDDAFSGSLPAFVTAFTRGRKLSAKEVDELMKIIDEAREEKP